MHKDKSSRIIYQKYWKMSNVVVFTVPKMQIVIEFVWLAVLYLFVDTKN